MKTVLILCGGKSEEHEISLISAHYVLEALDRNLFKPVVVGISRKGKWYLEDEKAFFKGPVRADKISLNEDAPSVQLSPFTSDSGRGLLDVRGKKIEFDVVFPILHGPFGEDGTLQGLFDIVGVPYVGPNCGSSWICMDKGLTKVVCKYWGIRVADFVCISSMAELEQRTEEIAALGSTLFVKPARLGSSVGITKVKRPDELKPAVASAFKHDSKVLIERAIVGREIECAVLGLNRSPRAALPGEIVPNKTIGFYSYEAKYLLPDGAELFAPAQLNSSTTKAVQQFALNAFQRLECDGMARMDLFLEHPSGLLYLNEANTIPGFTPISMYPKLWLASGLTYTQLITELLNLAFARVNPSNPSL
ncbi:MAG: D-alanine--D-alanine ligase [Deltaproteobacteria bacterium]|nr:D-alanine--D-alanine ligase [Deltaproteobacteria bacterium]